MKLVILDRNGTLNEHREDFVKSDIEWMPLPGALEAVARLNHAGWHVVIASNQSGLGRGLFDVASLNAMHAKMHKMLAAVGGRVEAVFYCPHSPDEGCECRKPKPGMLLEGARKFAVDTKRSFMVGDRWRDIEAGQHAGCRTIFIDGGYEDKEPARPADARVHSLRQAVDWILEECRKGVMR